MPSWIKQAIYLHAALGFMALAAGAVALAAGKGGGVHRRAGSVFVAALLAAVVVAQPAIYARRNIFLACLTPLVVSMAVQGYRSSGARRSGMISALWIDRAVAAAAGMGGAALVIVGIRMYMQGASIDSFAGAFVGLGYVAIQHARREWSSIDSAAASADRKALLIAHATGMLGAYTAAVTAFVAVNFHTESFSPVLVWLVPPFLGGLAIKRWEKTLAGPETSSNAVQ